MKLIMVFISVLILNGCASGVQAVQSVNIKKFNVVIGETTKEEIFNTLGKPDRREKGIINLNGSSVFQEYLEYGYIMKASKLVVSIRNKAGVGYTTTLGQGEEGSSIVFIFYDSTLVDAATN